MINDQLWKNGEPEATAEAARERGREVGGRGGMGVAGVQDIIHRQHNKLGTRRLCQEHK